VVHSGVDDDADAEDGEEVGGVSAGWGGGAVLDAVEDGGELVEVDAVADGFGHVGPPARNMLPLLPSTT
jgi:hypothetical protein